MRGWQWFINFVCLVQVILEVLPPAVARSAELADQHLASERVLHLNVFPKARFTIDFGWYTGLADVGSMFVKRPRGRYSGSCNSQSITLST